MITRISRRPGFASGATVTSAKTSSVWARTAGLRSSSANILSIRSIRFCFATSFSDGAGPSLASVAAGSVLRGPMGAGNSNQAILAAITSPTVVSFFCNSFSCCLSNAIS